MDVEMVGKFLSSLPDDDDHPYRTGPWRPQTTEWDADDLTVIDGEIPADLAAGIPGTTAVSADVVECWDSSFAVVASDMAPDELEAHLGRTPAGDIAQCAFTDSAFADDT